LKPVKYTGGDSPKEKKRKIIVDSDEYNDIFQLCTGNVLQKYVCHLTIILLKLDDIQVLLEMKENVFYVT
jgi:hypothetical protein